MLRREFLLCLSAGALSDRSLTAVEKSHRAFERWQGGVNLAGAEFGANRHTFSARTPGVHGKDYIYNSPVTTSYFCENNLKLIRFPFRWERIQPQLGEALDVHELSRLRTFVSQVGMAGGNVVLDLHNYGEYVDRIGSERVFRRLHMEERIKEHVGIQSFCNVWKRLAEVFSGDVTVAGYGLMNEPHDLPAGTWKAASQEAVNAIRSVDRRTAIVVSGDSWANATRFEAINGRSGWVEDSADNIVYEAHCYFDKDYSGQYAKTYAEESNADSRMRTRGSRRVSPFLSWCRRNGVRGLLGEVGVPSGPEWLSLLQDCVDACRKSDIALCGWAAGDWWGNYPLTIQPANGVMKPQGAAIGAR